ncbi:MAG: hypothetical protein WCD35_14010, partial [Mycobacteriales bacterium]
PDPGRGGDRDPVADACAEPDGAPRPAAPALVATAPTDGSATVLTGTRCAMLPAQGSPLPSAARRQGDR